MSKKNATAESGITYVLFEHDYEGKDLLGLAHSLKKLKHNIARRRRLDFVLEVVKCRDGIPIKRAINWQGETNSLWIEWIKI